MFDYHSNYDRRQVNTNKNNMDCLVKKGRTLEEFLELYHEARWDDEALKYIFWSGMDDNLGKILLLKKGHSPLINFIINTLWVCRSSLTVGVVKEDNISSETPEPVPPPAAISLPAPNRITHNFSPECPTIAE